MSTSIAALPCYKASKATKTKARADRTIFGTTLDSYGKVSTLLQNKILQAKVEALYENRHKKWRTPTPHTQSLRQAAWGIKNFSQPEIGEALTRDYSRLGTHSYTGSCALDVESLPETPTYEQKENSEDLGGVVKERKQSLDSEKLWVTKNKFGVYMVSSEDIKGIKKAEVEKFGKPKSRLNSTPRAASSTGVKLSSKHKDLVSAGRNRPRTTMSTQRNSSPISRKQSRSSKSAEKVQVPKFHFPPSARNYMRTSSLKITETGAKDLINSEPINKIGLGGTNQYNHEWYRRQDTPMLPNAYRDLGNVFLTGQKFYGDTTNKDVTGPGGFYQIKTKEDEKETDDTKTQYSVPSVTSRRTYDAAKPKKSKLKKSENADTISGSDSWEEIIPTNIIHKYGAEEVQSLLKGKEREVEKALRTAAHSDLTHTGMVPPRAEIPELNHPIDPPAAYYSNYGQSLKYDKFEGGLHLYIN